MMARKGLPRKYAKMGFKKGWAAYKRSKRKRVTTTPSRRARSVSRSKPRSRTMARRRRRTYTRKRKSYRRTGERLDLMAVGGAAVFDAIATPLITQFTPIKLPYANATEAVAGYVMYKYLFKKGKINKILKYYTIANAVTAVGNMVGGMNLAGVLAGGR